jgi:hypothetical protein
MMMADPVSHQVLSYAPAPIRHPPLHLKAEACVVDIRKIEKPALNGDLALPERSELPVRVDRETAAKLLTQYYFRTHRRSLERWPLTWRLLNGRAHCETAELFALAEAKLAEAPPVMGGRRIEAA